MKNLILIPLLITSLISVDVDSINDQEKKASGYIKIYSKHDGKPGYPRENWYAENKSKDQAIRITVTYWNGNFASADKWTKSFDLEPGEKKGIGTKRSGISETTYAKLSGARFKR
ncbi:MAG: hypothetical protein Roseis2KO_50950 [Roseivirga sp.]